MELNKLFKGAPLAFIIVGITMFAMNQPRIKILTSDEDEIEVPKDLALQSSFIGNIIGDLGELDAPVPLPNVNTRDLSLTFSIVQEINQVPHQDTLKREDGKYIAQRIQPAINQVLAGTDNATIAQLIYVAQYLDFEYIANGAIRVLVQKALAQNPNATVAIIKATYFFNPSSVPPAASSVNVMVNQNRPQLPDTLEPILEYQYQLVKNGNIPELSVADYIAINGMPRIAAHSPLNRMSIFLEKSNLTSLYGLDQISTRTTIECAYLQKNKLTTLPRESIFVSFVALKQIFLEHNALTELPPTSFNGLKNLQELHLPDNRLTTLPAGIFNPLSNLTFLDLQRNMIVTLPQGVFAPLVRLAFFSIKQNPVNRNIPNTQLRTEYSLAVSTTVF